MWSPDGCVLPGRGRRERRRPGRTLADPRAGRRVSRGRTRAIVSPRQRAPGCAAAPARLGFEPGRALPIQGADPRITAAERRHMTTSRRSAPALLAHRAGRADGADGAAGGGSGRDDGEAGAGAAQPGVRRGAARPAGHASASGACPARWRCTWARPPRPAPRAWPSPRPTPRRPRAASRRSRTRASDATCWAFANIAALESKLMPADPAPDFSEDNLVRRSGYGPFPRPDDGTTLRRLRLHGRRLLRALGRPARSRRDDPYATSESPPPRAPCGSTCRAWS